MKLILTFLFLLMLIIPMNSQAVVWPISGVTAPDQIDSDYGPRNVSKGSPFHYGLDFFVNTVSVKSITTTTISDIRLLPTSKTGNYVQTASGFRYLHLSAKTATYEIRTSSTGTNYIVFKDTSGSTTRVLSSVADVKYRYDQ